MVRVIGYLGERDYGETFSANGYIGEWMHRRTGISANGCIGERIYRRNYIKHKYLNIRNTEFVSNLIRQ